MNAAATTWTVLDARGVGTRTPLEVRSQTGFTLHRDDVFTDLDGDQSPRCTKVEKRVTLGRTLVDVFVEEWSYGRPSKQAEDLAASTLERYLDLFVVPAP